MKLLAYILLAKAILGLCVLLVWSDTASSLFLGSMPYVAALAVVTLVLHFAFSLCRAAAKSVPSPHDREVAENIRLAEEQIECWRRMDSIIR